MKEQSINPPLAYETNFSLGFEPVFSAKQLVPAFRIPPLCAWSVINMGHDAQRKNQKNTRN